LKKGGKRYWDNRGGRERVEAKKTSSCKKRNRGSRFGDPGKNHSKAKGIERWIGKGEETRNVGWGMSPREGDYGAIVCIRGERKRGKS